LSSATVNPSIFSRSSWLKSIWIISSGGGREIVWIVSSSSAVFNPSSCSTLCNRRLPFFIVDMGFLRLLFVEFSTEVFFAFFGIGGLSTVSGDDAGIGVFERFRVEGCSGDGTLIGCLTSTVFGRLITGSVGLVVSGGETVDVFGFDRFRLTRFVGNGGEVVVTIISGSGIGSIFFSLRVDRFDVFFFGWWVVDVT